VKQVKAWKNQMSSQDNKSTNAKWISKICILLQLQLNTTTLFHAVNHWPTAEKVNPTSNMLSKMPSLMTWVSQCHKTIKMFLRIHLFSLDMVSIHSLIWCTNSFGWQSLSPSFSSHWWLNSENKKVWKKSQDICSTNSPLETWVVLPLLAPNIAFLIISFKVHATMVLCPLRMLNSVFWAPLLTNKPIAEIKPFGL